MVLRTTPQLQNFLNFSTNASLVLFLDEKNQKSRRYKTLRNNCTPAPSRAKAIIALLRSHVAAAPYRHAYARFDF